MTARIWLRLAETFVPVLIAVTIILAWEADRRDRAQLATQLAAAQQTISQAASQQKDRDALLNQTLSQLAAQKQSTVTTAELLQALPQAFNLPQPIALQPGNAATNPNVGARFSASPNDARATNYQPEANTVPQSGQAGPAGLRLPETPKPQPGASPNAVIPAADLKPLYDFALDCKTCQAKLATAQSDLADEKTKSAALTKQRDAAITAAKGGTVLRRIARAAKWFALGAAAGAIAAKATR